ESGGGLAVAWRAIEENGAAGVQGRAGLLDHAVVKGKIAEGLSNAVEGDELVGELLHVDPEVEFLEGNGAGTGVAETSQSIESPAPAFFSEGIAQIDRVIGIARTQGLEQLALDGHADEIENNVVRQFDGFNELACGLETIAIDEFEQQGHHVDFVDAHRADVSRLRGDSMHEGAELFLGN